MSPSVGNAVRVMVVHKCDFIEERQVDSDSLGDARVILTVV